MIKIPTLYLRGEDFRMTPEVNPACEWVLRGEGIALQKMDGTAIWIDKYDQVLKRRSLRKGQAAPPKFHLAEHDPATGKTYGWVPVTSRREDERCMEAILLMRRIRAVLPNQPTKPWLVEGTYELVGPGIQGNPEGYDYPTLVKHDTCRAYAAPTQFDRLRKWLKVAGVRIEGLVWYHPDGRMAKIKLSDFDIARWH